MLCREIMKTSVRCLSVSDTVQLAALTMRNANIGFLPICDDDGRVLGTITDRDLSIRVLADGLSPLTPVTAVMTPEVVACLPEDDVRVAEQRMARGRVSRMIVVGDDNVLRGVISLSDLAQRDEAGAMRTLRAVSSRERASIH
ncbi:MAG: CBS domain-containing protein [Deltaproteobacteria bacterium]|nr:CBS domain-containing protein [Deltaproteobacteria bacterium]